MAQKFEEISKTASARDGLQLGAVYITLGRIMASFGENYEKCFTELYAAEDIFVVLIRGHLYCEAALADLLRQNLKFPEELNIDRLDYQAKVNLCAALGLFGAFALKPGMSKLGSLRNRFVHQLEYKATEQDLTDLLNTVKGSLGMPAQFLLRRGTEYPNGFRKCVMALWVPLALLCAPMEERKSARDLALKFAAKVLDAPEEELRKQADADIKAFGGDAT